MSPLTSYNITSRASLDLLTVSIGMDKGVWKLSELPNFYPRKEKVQTAYA